MKQGRIECLTEIFDELGIIATQEQISKVVDDFGLHLEMESELSSYRHDVSHKEECTKCKQLEEENKRLQKENKIYNDSVKRRRNANYVYIEGDSVMYE